MVASSKSHKLSLKNTKCYLKDVYNKVLVLLKKYKWEVVNNGVNQQISY